MLKQGWRDVQVIAGGVRLRYVAAGRSDAPLVVLLHGFPEGWSSWRHQMDALADAGWHVVAPDMRGYGCSEKPPGVGAYTVEALAGDVAALIGVLGNGRPAAAVVGHDWGGGITWVFGGLYPTQAHRLAVINCPHPAALFGAWRHPTQLLRSWYIAFFQLPWLPEAILLAGGLRFLDAALAPARRRNPEGITQADLAYQKHELARRGALTAAINYYRAVVRRPPSSTRHLLEQGRLVAPPTLLIWGEQDPYLGAELTADAAGWGPRVQLQRLPEAGHFCHQEYPRLVNRWLTTWIQAGRDQS